MWMWGVILALLIVDLLFACRSIDRLIRWQHDSHFDAWVADGKPQGMYARFPESDWLGSEWAFNRVALLWLFHTPAWARDDEEALSILKRVRWTVAIWCLGLPPVFICCLWRL